MSLFRRERRNAAEDSWQDFGWHEGAVPNDRAVTEWRALSLSYVYAAIRHISDYGSTLPLDFYRSDGDRRAPAPMPALFRSLADRGELEHWLGQAMSSLLIHGNAVGVKINVDGYGYPTNVLWLPRWYYSVDDSIIGRPRWFVNGTPTSADDLVHVSWLTIAGYTLGLSPLQYLAASVESGLNAQNYGRNWFHNGGFPPAVFKNTKRVLPEGAADQVSAKLQSTIAKGRPLVTGADWDFSAVQIPPNQAAFVETQKLTATQIAACYGIDPTEIGGEPPGSLTYSTDETRQIKRAANIQPYLVKFERVFNANLPNRVQMKFNTDAYIRANIQTRYQVYQEGLAMGILNRNTVRANEDLPPIPGGEEYQQAPVSAPQSPAPAVQQQDGTRLLSLIQQENA